MFEKEGICMLIMQKASSCKRISVPVRNTGNFNVIRAYDTGRGWNLVEDRSCLDSCRSR